MRPDGSGALPRDVEDRLSGVGAISCSGQQARDSIVPAAAMRFKDQWHEGQALVGTLCARLEKRLLIAFRSYR